MDSSDYFYLDLKTLSQLEEYDKLGLKYIENNIKLVVDKYSYIGFVKRAYNKYDRLSVLNYLKDFLNRLEKYVDTLVKGNLIENSNKLEQPVKDGVNGLKKLKETYIFDSYIVAEIDLLIYKMEEVIEKLNQMTQLLDHIDNAE